MGSAKRWNVKNVIWIIAFAIALGFPQLLLAEEDETLTSFAIHPGGNFIAIATSEVGCHNEETVGYQVSVVSYPDAELISMIDVGAPCQITNLQWSSDGHYLIIADQGGNAYVWDNQSQHLVSK